MLFLIYVIKKDFDLNLKNVCPWHAKWVFEIYIYIYIFKKKREEIIGFIPYLISRKKTYLIIGKNVKNVR